MRECEERGREPARTTDLSSTTLTNDVVEAICDYRGIDPLESGFSLYRHVDTEALDDLVASVSSDFALQFTVEDTRVCVCKSDAETVNIYVGDCGD